MKRFLVFLLVLTMGVMTVATAEGADIDLSGKTVDELIEIQKAVSEAIYAQGGKIVLPSGEFVAGVDIAPGSYILEPHNVSDDSHGRCYAVTVWKSKEAMEQFDAVREAYVTAYKNAESNKASGKDYEYPTGIVESDYKVFSGEFDNTQIAKITLEEGNILQWSTMLRATLDLTIEKAASFFMD